jgi:hypothetical protein
MELEAALVLGYPSAQPRYCVFSWSGQHEEDGFLKEVLLVINY